MSNPWVADAVSRGALLVLGPNKGASQWDDDGPNGLHATVVGATLQASGGPGPSLPNAYSMDGVDDVIHIAHDAILNLGAANGDPFTIEYIGTRIANDPNFQPYWAKGDVTYQLRTTTGSGHVRFDLRGGTGGNVNTQDNAFLGAASSFYGVWARYDDPNEVATRSIRVFRTGSGLSSGITAGDTAARDGTFAADADAWFTIGAQDNSTEGTTFRRFSEIVVSGVAIFPSHLSTTDMEDRRALVFEEPTEDEFDPDNLSVTVDGATASLDWDASPLLVE